MRRLRFPALAVLVAIIALASGRVRADDTFVWLRFEQYLEALRQQAGIAGLSGIVLKDGRIVWERGFGFQDIEAGIRTTPDTPYHVAGLTQSLAATLMLQCVERGTLALGTPVVALVPALAPSTATVWQVLSHTADLPDLPPGSTAPPFKFDLAKYAQLSGIVDQCAAQPYRAALARDILDRLAMTDSVPGAEVLTPGVIPPSVPDVPPMFDAVTLARYAGIAARLAKPYKVDKNGRPALSVYPNHALDAAGGLISTARDLARFDAALDDGVLIFPETFALATTAATAADGRPLPHGLGWFVQTYNGERIVWQFGNWPEASSALVVKVPARRLTLILLANGDRLSAPFNLQNGDVTTSLFAKLFLRLFL
jgi:CubicO group peptidase (beta-lactamase class C family)